MRRVVVGKDIGVDLETISHGIFRNVPPGHLGRWGWKSIREFSHGPWTGWNVTTLALPP